MLPLLAAIAVAASAGLSTVKPPSLDMVEYSNITHITVQTSLLMKYCKTKSIDTKELTLVSNTLLEYQTHLTDSADKIHASKEIVYLLNQLNDKEDYTSKYCQHKLSEIQSVSRTLARSVGGLHKIDICDANFAERISLYEMSFKQKEITELEFKELLEDVKHIAKTDRSACSIENSVKLDQAMDIASKVLSVLTGI